MEFTINRDTFLKSLSHANGIIEKKTSLPILSNIFIEAKESLASWNKYQMEDSSTDDPIPENISKKFPSLN